jgi:uncharacterized protein YqhQ
VSKDNRPSYGGQAVIEGVLMRGPGNMVLSVRDPDGNIVSLARKVESLTDKSRFARLPIVRGAVSFWESLSLGINILMKSAEIASPEDEKPSDNALTVAVAFAMVIGLGLFVILPSFGTAALMKFASLSGRYWVTFIESSLRMLLLVGYVVAISRMKDIQRVLEYHGAEHKVIWAFEKHPFRLERLLDCRCVQADGGSKCSEDVQNGHDNRFDENGLEAAVEFLAEKAKPESTLHPRCGTSLLFIAVLVTWILFLFISPKSILIRIISRIAMLPVVAGIAYEVLKHSTRREGAIWGLVKAPGIAMQKLTTREPDKGQLRVAATSLVLLIAEEHGLEFLATAGQNSKFRRITEEPVTGSDFKEKE